MPRSSVSRSEPTPASATGGEFCVVCGRADVATIDGECADCYAKHRPLVGVVQHPTVVLCPTCGARLVGAHWERSGTSSLLTSEDLVRFLQPLDEVGIRRVRWEETGANPLVRTLAGQLDIRFRGTERTVSVTMQVKIEHRTCLECSRRAGHYFTAVLQLRGLEERIKEPSRVLRARIGRVWDHVLPEARTDWKNAFSWREERPEGWDVYFKDKLAARAMARWMKDRLGAELKESPSLYGRKDGHDVYRVTFCLRIPPEADPEYRRPPRPAPP
jgi:nonsense-mediated mRNA decay protein 3